MFFKDLHTNCFLPETSSFFFAQPKLRQELRIDYPFQSFGSKKSQNQQPNFRQVKFILCAIRSKNVKARNFGSKYEVLDSKKVLKASR
jgi:hypothetical protein